MAMRSLLFFKYIFAPEGTEPSFYECTPQTLHSVTDVHQTVTYTEQFMYYTIR